MGAIRLAKGQFKFRGKDSKEFGTSIETEPQIKSAERVFELRERPGNFDYVADFKYYRPVPITLECFYKSTSRDDNWQVRDEISAWCDTGNYEDLILYMDPQYLYKAIVTSPPDFKGNRATGKSVPFNLEMTLQPFKYDLFGLEKKILTKEKTLINHKRYASKPYLKIYGEGAISIFINGQEFKMIGVQGNIEIDSLEEEVSRYDKKILISQSKNYLNSNFPLFVPGENKISWKGNVSKVEIIPRWWTKL